MTFEELLGEIRQNNLDAFTAAMAAHPGAFVEPAYCLADGSLAVAGRLSLPLRVDLIPVVDGVAGEPIMVDSQTRLNFEPFEVSIGSMDLLVSPFDWDALNIRVEGIALEDLDRLLASWFFAWFDAEDQNASSDIGLYDVVHYLSEPAHEGDQAVAQIDLGSARPIAVLDLLDRLSEARVSRCELT